MAYSGPPVGLLPAAGRGVRFGSSGYAKELFPVLLDTGRDAGHEGDDSVEPRPVCDLALRALQAAGATRCVVVLSRDKPDMLRVLGDGSAVGMDLAYVVQPAPRGLPDVVRCARPWIGDADTVFAMPDTVFFPRTAVREVNALRVATGADLVLGVFPVDEPERLGPVEADADGLVLRIYDKPASTPYRNTWGVASWTARFTEFCGAWDEAERLRNPNDEPALGHVFEAARKAGLSVRAVHFPEGRFLDVGTPRGLRAALAALATSTTK